MPLRRRQAAGTGRLQESAELEGDWKTLPTFFHVPINNGWR